MHDEMKHDEHNTEQVADALVARRRFVQMLTIAAGVGVLAVPAYGKVAGKVGGPAPNTACDGASFNCNPFSCPAPFSCAQSFGCKTFFS